jgi:hypothetical protein
MRRGGLGAASDGGEMQERGERAPTEWKYTA